MLSLAACAWLYSENRSLSDELSEARSAAEPTVPTRAAAAPALPSPELSTTSEASPEPVEKPRPEAGSENLAARPERPSLAEEAPKETRQERRKRNMDRVTAIFGRLDDETEEEYLERMVPFVETALAMPRSKVEEARRAAEEAAGVDDEQRAQLDAAFNDAFVEALALTNRAVASGDLSPYERNWSGAMNVAGGLGAVLEGTESRIGEILTLEQRQTIYDQGFEWGEYLGVTVPWEQLRPPPPPPGG